MLTMMNNRWLLLLVCLLGGLVASSGCSRDPEHRKRAYFDSAQRYMTEQKYAEAIVEFRNAVQIDPAFGEAHEGLSNAFAARGDAAGSIRELIRAADLLPLREDIQLRAGTVLLLAGRYDDARVRAGKALAANPKSIPAQILDANALAGLKDFEKALAEIDQAIALDPVRSSSFSALGAVQIARGRSAEAEQAFRRAVELDGRSVDAHLALGNFLWVSGRPAEAEGAFLRARSEDPTHVLANRALSAFYLGTNRAPEAEPFLRALADRAGDVRPRLILADYYATLGRYREALDRLDPLATDPSSGVDARLRIAVIRRLQGDAPGAYRLVDEILAENPRQVRALLTRARLLIGDGRHAEAAVPAAQAVEGDASLSEGHYLLGLSRAGQRDVAGAKQAFARVLELNPRAAAAQFQLAQLELAAGNAAASRGHAEVAVSAEPGNPETRLLLARTYMAEGNLTAAQRELTSLAESRPDWAAVHTNLGLLALRRQDDRAARASLETAVRLDAKAVEPFAALVSLDVRSGRLADARTRVDARLAAAPDDPTTLLMAARAYALLKDVAKSEQLLKALLQRDPANIRAYADLAQMYLRAGRADEARAAFEQVATREPKSVMAQTMIGVLLQSQNRPAEAARRYEQALSTEPASPVAANNLAWIYATEGQQLERALELAKSAKRGLPDRGEVSDTLGYVYLKKQVPDLAVPALRDAVKQDPENPQYRLRLGIALARSGKADDARRELGPVLRAHPNLPEAAEARAALARLP